MIEFRFNTSYPQHQLLVFSTGSSAAYTTFNDGWAVEIEAHHSASQTTSGYYKHGRMNVYAWADPTGSSGLEWMSGSSEWLPLFDNDWWNIQMGPKYGK